MLSVTDWFRTKSAVGRKGTELYGSIVTQARNPILYTDYAIPDTLEKRYETVALHTSLVLQALDEFNLQPLAQSVAEAFVRDMDDSMREMAVGDTKVPAKVKRAAAGLLERNRIYQIALNDDDPQVLVDTLSGLIFDGANPITADYLANYVRASRHRLRESQSDLDAGIATFANPSDIAMA